MLSELQLPTPLPARSTTLTLRRATIADLAALIDLLANDPISASRGDVAAEEDLDLYARGMERTLASDSNELLIAEDANGLAGTFQLTLIPGLSRRGSTRVLVEAVRVVESARNAGIGEAMMRWVMDVAAPALEAQMIQLTSDAARTDAHRFYKRLGFADSHVGFKYQV